MRTLERLQLAWNRRVALLLVILGALALLVFSGFALHPVEFGSVGTVDFVAYWSAARVALDGGNPYDPAALLAVERTAGWPFDDALLMYNPPWTLILILPVALVPFGHAAVLWTWLQTLGILASGLLLWRYFKPEAHRPWFGLIVPAGFYPVFSAILVGQVSFWFLVGVVGFLWAERRGWNMAAGAALALLMIKPHVTYLFWLAALWWAWQVKRRRVLIGWLLGLLGASALVLTIAPNAFADYAAAFGQAPMSWRSAASGTWLRMLLGWEMSWLQFAPSLLGGVGLVAWLSYHRGPWRWEVLAGPLLLASVITMAYGWSHDGLVLLPAVVSCAITLRAKSTPECAAILVIFVAAQLGLAVISIRGIPDHFTVWHAPLLAGLYAWAKQPGGATERLRDALLRVSGSAIPDAKRTQRR